MMNELYNILDLYLITSRLEGGPQALVECGQTKQSYFHRCWNSKTDFS